MKNILRNNSFKTFFLLLTLTFTLNNCTKKILSDSITSVGNGPTQGTPIDGVWVPSPNQTINGVNYIVEKCIPPVNGGAACVETDTTWTYYTDPTDGKRYRKKATATDGVWIPNPDQTINNIVYTIEECVPPSNGGAACDETDTTWTYYTDPTDGKRYRKKSTGCASGFNLVNGTCVADWGPWSQDSYTLTQTDLTNCSNYCGAGTVTVQAPESRECLLNGVVTAVTNCSGSATRTAPRSMTCNITPSARHPLHRFERKFYQSDWEANTQHRHSSWVARMQDQLNPVTALETEFDNQDRNNLFSAWNAPGFGRVPVYHCAARNKVHWAVDGISADNNGNATSWDSVSNAQFHKNNSGAITRVKSGIRDFVASAMIKNHNGVNYCCAKKSECGNLNQVPTAESNFDFFINDSYSGIRAYSTPSYYAYNTQKPGTVQLGHCVSPSWGNNAPLLPNLNIGGESSWYISTQAKCESGWHWSTSPGLFGCNAI